MNGAGVEHPAAARREPDEMGRAVLVDFQEGIEPAATRMAPRAWGSIVSWYSVGSESCGFPLARLRIDSADRVTARSGPWSCQIVLPAVQADSSALDLAARRCNLLSNDVSERKVLEQGDDVSECSVKRAHVWIAWRQEPCVHPIDERMCCLVRHDVVREAGEHQTTRYVIARLLSSCEVTDRDTIFTGEQYRVAFAQRMGVDAQTLHEHRVVLRIGALRKWSRAPQAATPQCELEMANREARDCVRRFADETAGSPRSGETVLCEERFPLEVDGFVEASACRIHVDHFEVFANAVPASSGSHGSFNSTSLIGARSTAVVKLGMKMHGRAGPRYARLRQHERPS